MGERYGQMYYSRVLAIIQMDPFLIYKVQGNSKIKSQSRDKFLHSLHPKINCSSSWSRLFSSRKYKYSQFSTKNYL